MSKGERIEAYVHSLGFEGAEHDPCYLAYFTLFNQQEYFEAHDVLEHLWLQGVGADYGFYKGLIQLAGAFVHLKRHRQCPLHPIDGRRLHPGVRLFRMAITNISPYTPRHYGLEIAPVLDLATSQIDHIVASEFSDNPWHPDRAPRLSLHIV